eukprot:CAMPEP_0174756746 /NCGR_PEP_ID=MMETSP1094-20130205/106910_1 /TAXON_ID=156173 /ORGANISM="Chrysochromulina brevifilum, Strain UTEX LB 985" /LENGTH=317 /DNA_ID=CAMNT_0015962657 /DNA_START=53 /DNA_END=1006 /DNA_ORIENTATION=+
MPKGFRKNNIVELEPVEQETKPLSNDYAVLALTVCVGLLMMIVGYRLARGRSSLKLTSKHTKKPAEYPVVTTLIVDETPTTVLDVLEPAVEAAAPAEEVMKQTAPAKAAVAMAPAEDKAVTTVLTAEEEAEVVALADKVAASVVVEALDSAVEEGAGATTAEEVQLESEEDQMAEVDITAQKNAEPTAKVATEATASVGALDGPETAPTPEAKVEPLATKPEASIGESPKKRPSKTPGLRLSRSFSKRSSEEIQAKADAAAAEPDASMVPIPPRRSSNTRRGSTPVRRISRSFSNGAMKMARAASFSKAQQRASAVM